MISASSPASLCPLCQTPVLPHFINLVTTFSMCANQECVYPFQMHPSDFYACQRISPSPNPKLSLFSKLRSNSVSLIPPPAPPCLEPHSLTSINPILASSISSVANGAPPPPLPPPPSSSTTFASSSSRHPPSTPATGPSSSAGAYLRKAVPSWVVLPPSHPSLALPTSLSLKAKEKGKGKSKGKGRETREKPVSSKVMSIQDLQSLVMSDMEEDAGDLGLEDDGEAAKAVAMEQEDLERELRHLLHEQGIF